MSAISQQEDKQYERKGLIYALIFHAVLLVSFFFWIVLKKVNTEAGGGTPGEIVNFGFDEIGSGDNNSMDQVTTQVDQTPQEAQEPQEASTDDANLTTTDPNAETVVDDTKKPAASTPVTPTTKPTPTPTTKPATNPNAQMGALNKPGVDGGDGVTGKPGNQGSQTGSLNSQNYYNEGTGGKGNGTLNMAGWHLDADPKVANPNKESGNIVFTVKIDAKGDVVGVVIKTRTINDAALIEKCKSEIKEKMEFVKNRDNTNSDENSTYTGTITFVFVVN
ncbi:hypothetical protein [Cytophaga aurantiaca]|uniref:hypothetical protein n=1 Tax=Cytophaga aurantiaca TaxID=29530 RepID=UPI000378257F|nr:hypothetical protein [Cytophaga aurantiaca]